MTITAINTLCPGFGPVRAAGYNLCYRTIVGQIPKNYNATATASATP
jgi:hypothetical protein